MKRPIMWSMLIALCIVLGLVGLAAAQQPRYGGTLRVAWEQDVTGFDPHWSAGLQNIYLAGNLFNGLVTVDEHLNYVPDLAESWEVQDNGKVYVFRLHKGVKFHDGTDLDAAAVAWNFERIMDPEEKALTRPYLEVIEAVEPLDAHTVKFTLKYPTQTFLPALAVYPRPFLIKAPSTYKTWGRKDAHLHPIGTGPFKLARWEQNQIIVLEKNPDYFKKGLPYLDRIELKIMKDGITRATALRAGEVDFLNYVPKEMVERISKDPKLQLLRGQDTQSVNISFNNGKKPFDDVRVRQAVGGYGIDRHAIAKTAMLGLGQALWSFVPPGGKDYIDFEEEFPYNLCESQSLAEGGRLRREEPPEVHHHDARRRALVAHDCHHHQDATGSDPGGGDDRGDRSPDFLAASDQRPGLGANGQPHRVFRRRVYPLVYPGQPGGASIK